MNPDPFHGKTKEEVATDFFATFLTGGIHGAFGISEAIAEDDPQEVYYAATIEAMHLSFLYGSLKFLNWYQGPKYAMTFHQLHRSMGPARAQFVRATVANPAFLPVALGASTAAQVVVWEEIGDPMTGAVHYSGAGTMSGGSMPVIPGDGGHHSTWFDFGDWWESL